jgi:molybdopterin molybdotransferase
LDFQAARQCVIDRVSAARALKDPEMVPLGDAAGRMLAEDVLADRDYPPVSRSVRDGFAVRAADLPGELRVIGEVRAGESYAGTVGDRQAVEIMTGAPVPAGADAVVMVEHVTREGERIRTSRRPVPGEFINPQGAELQRGAAALGRGVRLGYTEIALLATVGRTCVEVYGRPRVAILPTGDEIVEIDASPRDFEVRNSNAHSLAVQVRAAGGYPEILSVARDNLESTGSLVEQGLGYDLLLLSGGVSAGKYDFVEQALSAFGAEFFFDRVLIQPGQPLVFGRAKGKFFFGLPGNPASTMVTFELFARAALELLGGQTQAALPMPLARLTAEFRHKTGLTRFLPARVSADGSEVTPVHWQGSSDVPALSRANAFMVAEADRESWAAGDMIRILLK